MKRRRAAAAVVCACVMAVRPAAAQERVDRRTAESAIMKADRDFNQAVADRDMNRFLLFVAEDASFEEAAARGREAVAKVWAQFFLPDGPKVSWKPTRAEVLVGGDVGYTLGTWLRRRRESDGTVTTTRGNYLTVWRKQMDGAWRAIFDTGSTEPMKK